ncbi:MAG: hypothetical protein KDA33_12995 [Phycisphaerales bacterium]|nr:hypothetical protein [Phycisphaerales bacterium]
MAMSLVTRSHSQAWGALAPRLVALLFGCAIASNVFAGTASYTAVNLGAPPGADSVVGVRLNNLGQVAGWSQYFGQGEPSIKGWVWSPGTGFEILPPPPGFFFGRSRAMDISDTGIVAGDGGFDIGLAWRYENGAYTVTGDAEGLPIAYLGGVNDAGDLAGTAKDSQITTSDYGWLDVNNGALQTLTPLGGRATDLNNHRQVCGYFTSASGFAAYRWDATNGAQPLGTLGLAFSFATRINEAGDVVGYAASSTGNTRRAWIYSDTMGMREIPSALPNTSAAVSVNRHGHVVGISTRSGLDLNWLWTGGAGSTDIATLIDTVAENFNILAVRDINDAGQILIQVFDNNVTDYRMVVLTPIRQAGDIDGDGDVDVVDRDLFIAVLLGNNTNPVDIQRCDLNGDSVADGADAQMFVAALLGM